MGFLFILPYLVLCGWIIWSTHRNLRDYEASARWRCGYWILCAIGVPLGLWFATHARLRLPEMWLHGMPVPVYFERLVDGFWKLQTPPFSIRVGAFVADLISGPAALLFPFKLAALFRHFSKAVGTPP